MKPIRVLLADDEEELVTALIERLALRGITADGATTCETAFALLRDNRYDVAVLDVKLPRMSGFELKKQMARMAPGLRFIFITGHGSYSSFQEGTAEAGRSYYLLKPVDIELLAAKIREITASTENLTKDNADDT
jgi:DNA-binding NtrC family response regulator